MTRLDQAATITWRALRRLIPTRLPDRRGLPFGAAPLWLALRRGEDVNRDVLDVLKAQSHLNTPAIRQLARDLAFEVARVARRNEPDVEVRFIEKHRAADLGVLQLQVAEEIGCLLRDDRERHSFTMEKLADIAGRKLRRLADRELTRPGLHVR